MPPGLRRQPSPARPTWRETAYKLDYRYFVNEDKTEAWREDACYVFSPATVRKLAAIAEDLHRKALAVVRDAVDAPDGLTAFHVPQEAQDFVRASWRRDEPFLIGRFDFAWHNGQPKLIEYNADTPATLPESSQMQQQWHREVAPHTGQFPLDEARLIHRLRALAQRKWLGRTVHVVPYPDNLEDATHARYYQRWLALAGLDGVLCELRDLEISRLGRLLHRGRVVDSMIRMYPWELMLRDEGSQTSGRLWLPVFEPAMGLGSVQQGITTCFMAALPAPPSPVACQLGCTGCLPHTGEPMCGKAYSCARG